MTGILANRRAFLAAAITVLAALLAAEVATRAVFSAENIAAWHADDFLAHERDDHGRLVADAVAVANTEAPAGGRLILIGGSTIREGLLPDPVIQEQIDDRLGSTAPSVHTLYSFDQSMAETARIALSLKLGAGDTAVVGVNPRRFGFGDAAINQEFSASRVSLLPAGPFERLVATALVTDARPTPSTISELAVELGETALFSPWEEATVFQHRLFVRRWVEGRLPGTTTQAWGHVWAGQLTEVDLGDLTDLSFRDIRRPLRYGYSNQPLSDAEKEHLAKIVAETRVDEYFDNHELDLALTEALIEALTADGVKVVLLELPRTSLSVDAYGPVWDHYDTELDELAARTGAERLDLRAVPFTDDDFFDLEHLLGSGRARLTDEVFAGILGIELGLDDA